MTRKHFDALAYALYRTKPNPDDFETEIIYLTASAQWKITRNAIAQDIRGFNSNYDRERFIRVATEGK